LLVVAVILGVPFHQFPINFFGLAELVAFDQVNTLNERTKRELSRYQPSALTAKHTPRLYYNLSRLNTTKPLNGFNKLYWYNQLPKSCVFYAAEGRKLDLGSIYDTILADIHFIV